MGATPPTVTLTIAGVPVLVAAPARMTQHTPVIILYHGFGPPSSPQALAQALPPLPNVLTVYPGLPLVGTRMPAGGVDELIRRQREDYIGQLLYPSIQGAARELPQIIAVLRRTYKLSKASPIVLFGFSAGGAAALLSLTETDLRPRAVLVVNCPLSIAQAVDGYERQTKSAYVWSESAKDASAHYDIEKSAARIAALNPETAFLLLQSERDAGFSVTPAQAVAAALKNAASRHRPDPDISARVLSDSDHYVLTGSQAAIVNPMIMAWLTQHAF